MIVKIWNKEVQLTDYLSANQIKKALYETYEQGYQDGGSDMEKAKQIIIDSLLKQIEQIRADVIEEFAHALKETFNNEFPSNYHCTQPYFTLDNVRGLIDCVVKEQK